MARATGICSTEQCATALPPLLQPAQAACVCRFGRGSATERFAPAHRLGKVMAHMFMVLGKRFRGLQ